MHPSAARWRLTTAAVVLAAMAIAGASRPVEAQQASSPTVPAAAPQNIVVYEPGDVYLPSSRIYVFVGKTGFGHEHGVVGRLKSGRVRLDTPQRSGQLVFDIGSFVADSDEARNFVGLSGTTDANTARQVTANMLASAVLDAARYPTATFTVLGITPLPQPSPRGLPQYQFTGDFTLHGVTRRMQIVADCEEQNGWIHLRGRFEMLQSQFGITPFAKAFGAVGVSDQLSVWGDIWLSKARQTVPQVASRK